MDAWTRRVIRNRKKIVAAWLVLLVGGVAGAANLGSLLSNRFSVPGSDAERGLDLARDRLHERGDGAFTLIVQAERPIAGRPAFERAVERAAARGATAIPGARPGPVEVASPHVAYIQFSTPL